MGRYFSTQPHPHTGLWICPTSVAEQQRPTLCWGELYGSGHSREEIVNSGAQQMFGEMGILSIGNGPAGVHEGPGLMNIGRTTPYRSHLQVQPGFQVVTCVACQVVLSTPQFFPTHGQEHSCRHVPRHTPQVTQILPFLLFQGIVSCFLPLCDLFWGDLQSIILGWETLVYFSLPSQNNSSSFLRVSLKMGEILHQDNV